MYPLPMIGFVFWLALLALALIVFWRQPRLSGALFVALGVLAIVLRGSTSIHGQRVPLAVALGAGAIWFVIGIRQLVYPKSA
jgi:hypothetical protein